MSSRIQCERSGEAVTFSSSLQVGRHPDCDLVISEGAVSSRHAVIEVVDGRWRVRDQGSTNGTSLNNRRIKGSRKLSEGDRLRFGGGDAWRVAALGPVDQADALLATKNAMDLSKLRLVLDWDSPDAGRIRLELGETHWQTQATLPFFLLDALAERSNTWMGDEALRLAIWGRRRHEVGDNALHQLIYQTRRILQGWGLPGTLIEKRPNLTRLQIRQVTRLQGGEVRTG